MPPTLVPLSRGRAASANSKVETCSGCTNRQLQWRCGVIRPARHPPPAEERLDRFAGVCSSNNSSSSACSAAGRPVVAEISSIVSASYRHRIGQGVCGPVQERGWAVAREL
jgi:hypothetical protein